MTTDDAVANDRSSMIDAEIQSELLKQVERLSPPKQQRVIDFARSLTEPPRGVRGIDLLEFAGIMTPEEAKEFLAGIEEDCERIDPNEW